MSTAPPVFTAVDGANSRFLSDVPSDSPDKDRDLKFIVGKILASLQENREVIAVFLTSKSTTGIMRVASICEHRMLHYSS
jgi:hypothetical protein